MAYALITGASKGIGKALAHCLAERKYDLLLVARSAPLLNELTAQLQQQYQVKVASLAKDLAQPAAADEVANWIQENQFAVEILVNNAGYGLWGNFKELSLASQWDMMQLNMGALIRLTHHLIPILQQHSRAYILNVGSLAGYQAVPTLSVYAASKAFVNNFTRGLAAELQHTGISVTLLAPGGVKTDFIERSGLQHVQATADRLSMTPEAVAAIAIKALFKRKPEVIPGRINRFSAAMIKILPKLWTERLAARIYEKKT